MQASEAPPATAAVVSIHNRWGAFWKQQQRRWRQYDSISTACTMVLMTGNVLRSSGADSSYQTADSKQTLGATLLTYTVAIALHAWVLWLVTKSPGRYNPARNLLTCARWLLVSCLILVTTPLPVFQAGHSTSSPWVPLRWLQFSFRSGSMFCVHAFTFYLMPWPYMACMAYMYAAASSWAAASYCSTVTDMHLQQQTHADFSIVHAAATLLDTLVGQGTAQQGAGLYSTPEPAAAGGTTGSLGLAAAVTGMPVLPAGSSTWQAASSMVLAACEAANMQGGVLQQQACHRLLQGQCHASVITIHFGVTYVMLLLLATLERYNKWRFLQHQLNHQQHTHTNHQQPEGLNGSHQRAGSDPGGQPTSQGASSSSSPVTLAGSSRGPEPSGLSGACSSEPDLQQHSSLQQRSSQQSSQHTSQHSGHHSNQHSSLYSSQGYRGHHRGQRSLLLDPYTAPTAWALLRLELLKLVVLLDVPVLLLWWATSSVLRPTAAVQDLVGTAAAAAAAVEAPVTVAVTAL